MSCNLHDRYALQTSCSATAIHRTTATAAATTAARTTTATTAAAAAAAAGSQERCRRKSEAILYLRCHHLGPQRASEPGFTVPLYVSTRIPNAVPATGSVSESDAGPSGTASDPFKWSRYDCQYVCRQLRTATTSGRGPSFRQRVESSTQLVLFKQQCYSQSCQYDQSHGRHTTCSRQIDSSGRSRSRWYAIGIDASIEPR